MAVQGFYWLIEGELAGCGRPGGPGPAGRARGAAPPEDAPAEQLDADLTWLRRQGVDAIVSLTEAPLDSAALAAHGFAALHLPVDDLTAPTPAQLGRALTFIDWQRALGRAVAVHCRMGQGRTGTVLAAYLIRDGASSAPAAPALSAAPPRSAPWRPTPGGGTGCCSRVAGPRILAPKRSEGPRSSAGILRGGIACMGESR